MERDFNQVFCHELCNSITKTFSCNNIRYIHIEDICEQLKLVPLIVELKVHRKVKYLMFNDNEPIFFMRVNNIFIVGDHYDGKWHYRYCEMNSYDDPYSYVSVS